MIKMTLSEEEAEKLTNNIINIFADNFKIENIIDRKTAKLIFQKLNKLIRRTCGLENEYKLIIKFETRIPINEYRIEGILKNMAQYLASLLVKDAGLKQVTKRTLKKIEDD